MEGPRPGAEPLTGPGLVRFWFEFDTRGDDAAYGWLAAGAGVTGYDEADCLALLEEVAPGDLPPVELRVRDVDTDPRVLGIRIGASMGNPAWRGVWWPVTGIGT